MMVRGALIAFALALGVSPAWATGSAPNGPVCQPLAKIKAGFDSSYVFAPLTPGQYHLIQGFYLGSPVTPQGFPPGDGALLITHGGDKGGAILWTRGKDACITPIVVRRDTTGNPVGTQYMPLPIDAKMVAALTGVKTGVGETAPASKDDEGDLHL